jgi:hypothetical protein
VVVSPLFHVTAELNRDSITKHGLDWTRMGAARGIAGSHRAEAEGVFLCSDEHEADYFVEMSNTGGPVDVWAVSGVSEKELVPYGTGYWYLPRRIPPEDLTLVSASVDVDAPRRHAIWATEPTSAYQSNITLTFDNGTVVRDSEADEFMRRVRETLESGDQRST